MCLNKHIHIHQNVHEYMNQKLYLCHYVFIHIHIKPRMNSGIEEMVRCFFEGCEHEHTLAHLRHPKSMYIDVIKIYVFIYIVHINIREEHHHLSSVFVLTSWFPAPLPWRSSHLKEEGRKKEGRTVIIWRCWS